jgi:hypothetical protein
MIIDMMATESTEEHGKKKIPDRQTLINSSFVIPAYAGIQKQIEYDICILGLHCTPPGMTCRQNSIRNFSVFFRGFRGHSDIPHSA